MGAPIKAKDMRQTGVDTHPYMIQKKYSEPTYHTSFRVATAHITADIESLRDQFKRLNAPEVIAACEIGLDSVNKLPAEGGVVEFVADPASGLWYRAELVKREPVS